MSIEAEDVIYRIEGRSGHVDEHDQQLVALVRALEAVRVAAQKVKENNEDNVEIINVAQELLDWERFVEALAACDKIRSGK